MDWSEGLYESAHTRRNGCPALDQMAFGQWHSADQTHPICIFVCVQVHTHLHTRTHARVHTTPASQSSPLPPYCPTALFRLFLFLFLTLSFTHPHPHPHSPFSLSVVFRSAIHPTLHYFSLLLSSLLAIHHALPPPWEYLL